ncbi:MAG: hypothetical protein M1821_006588 [Bathelium mastoideum]|nr:MAG: hypothetical protein M1821_006588 [Bathelium mastoideum]
MSSTTGSPPVRGDVDLGPRLMAMFLTLSIVAFIFVSLRLAVRLKDQNLGLDDFCALMASVTFIGLAADVSYAAVRGTYRHKYYLSQKQVEIGLKTNTIGEAVIGVSETFGKSAIALLLIRLVGRSSKWWKGFLWSLIAITAIICVVTVFITFFQCHNPQAIWNLPLRATTSCWDPSVLSNEAIACSAWYTAVDFVLALFPLLILWELQMSLGRKIALVILLGLGIITGIFCALKTSLLPVLAHDSDASFQQFNLQVFSGIENFLLIVLGCVPVFKRPCEFAFERVSNSSLVTSLRRLYSNASNLGQDDSTVQTNKYARHEDSAYPLQKRPKTDAARGNTVREESSRSEWMGEPVRWQSSGSATKEESIYQVV